MRTPPLVYPHLSWGGGGGVPPMAARVVPHASPTKVSKIAEGRSASHVEPPRGAACGATGGGGMAVGGGVRDGSVCFFMVHVMLIMYAH